jgi:hypothetical protein
VLKPIIGIFIAVALVTPALADEYWVKYDYSTHECSIIKSAVHLTETRFPWSPPNDGRKPKGALDNGAKVSAGTATNGETGSASVDQTDTSSGSNSAADASSAASTASNSNATSDAANKAGPTNQSTSMGNTGATDKTNEDFEKQLAASWERKAELAKKDHIDVKTALIGSAMQSREQAEQEMKIMRMCGLNN